MKYEKKNIKLDKINSIDNFIFFFSTLGQNETA